MIANDILFSFTFFFQHIRGFPIRQLLPRFLYRYLDQQCELFWFNKTFYRYELTHLRRTLCYQFCVPQCGKVARIIC